MHGLRFLILSLQTYK